MNNVLNRWAALMLLVPSVGFALGVGEMEVLSKLNEPLRAQIELIYSDSAEAAETEVSLASAEDFERVGLSLEMLPAQLDFAVVRNDQGNYVIEVSSARAITEPVLDFLIEVEWENGRLLREYVIFLDPPVSPREQRAVEVSPVGEPEEQPVTEAREEPAQQPVSRPARAAGDGQSYGPVSRGDTLWEIARDRRPSDDISINQMMVMLLRMNPDAFYDSNVNALREGAVLRLPQGQDFADLADDSATSQVAEQNELWNAYVRSRTGREVPTVSDAGVDAQYETPVADVPADDESRLEIVPPAGESASAVDRPRGADEQRAAELREELSRAREELISARQENTELEDRVGELEDLIASMERAISLKDASLADLQAQLEQARQATGDQPIQAYPEDDLAAVDEPLADDPLGTDEGFEDDTGAADAAFEDDFGADAGDQDDLAATGAEGQADDVTGEGVDTTPAAGDEFGDQGAADDVSDTETAAADTAPVPVSPERPARPERSLLANPMVWGGAALVLLLLAAAGFMMYRRRQAEGSEEYEMFAGVEEEPVAEGEEEEAEAVPPPAAVTPESDETVESLEAAVAENPDDPQNHLALLRYHYAADNREGFLDAAENMRGHVGENHPAWMEVKAMGANVAPGAALFAAEAEEESAEAGSESEEMGFELEGSEVDDEEDEFQETRMMDVTGEEDLGLGGLDVDGTTGEHPTEDEDEEPAADEADDGSLDFDLEEDRAAPEAETGAEEEHDALDFDLDLEPEPETESPAADTESTADTTEEEDLDFDFDLEEDEAEPAAAPSEPTAAESEEDALAELDLEGIDEQSQETEDELDLDDLGLDLETGETDAVDASTAEARGDEHTEFDLEAFEPEEEQGDRSQIDTAELELDLDLDETEAPAEPTAETEPELEDESIALDDSTMDVEDEDLSDLELDDLDLSEGEADEEDAAGTKLDLARAYIDMGDPDGARGMLEEVMAEGSEEQKSEAKSLLDDLNS